MELAVTTILGSAIIYVVARGLAEIRRLRRVEQIRRRLTPSAPQRSHSGFLDAISARHHSTP